MKKDKALLIIDMQNGSFHPSYPCYDAKGVVERINTLSRKFREGGCPVIIIQHDGSLQNEYIPGTPDFAIIPSLEIASTDLRIVKTAHDAFYATELQRILDKWQINELVVTGSATEFCVESTIQSALIKDYTVVIVKDSHTTGDKPHLSAQKIIEHYNWVWENLIPTRGKIVLKEAREI